jgi:hypothetical protein
MRLFKTFPKGMAGVVKGPKFTFNLQHIRICDNCGSGTANGGGCDGTRKTAQAPNCWHPIGTVGIWEERKQTVYDDVLSVLSGEARVLARQGHRIRYNNGTKPSCGLCATYKDGHVCECDEVYNEQGERSKDCWVEAGVIRIWDEREDA